MARFTFLILSLLVVCATATAEEPEAAITGVLSDQAAAWNKGDIEGFMDGYLRSEELVFTSGGRIRRGWETTLQKYKDRYGTATDTMGQLAFDDVEVHSLGEDAAWVLGHWKLTWPDKSTEGGVFTLVMKMIDGNWKVVHDHTSASTD